MTIKDKQNGFNLIELMIVISILGVLMGIAIPAYQDYIKKAKFASVINNTAPIKTAIETCFYIQGDWGQCDSDESLIASVINDNSSGEFDEGSSYEENFTEGGITFTRYCSTSYYMIGSYLGIRLTCYMAAHAVLDTIAPVITITADESLDSATFILSAEVDRDTNAVTWTTSGTCYDLGYC